MRNSIVIYSLVITSIFAQVENIPYDWVGQYGAISNNGQIMWNQDWQVGPLLFDGTFSNYPIRYGKTYENNFKIREIGNIYNSIYTFPDSSNIGSKADYYRGDYSYDQLGMILNFEKKNRIIAIKGFKRTYKGPWAQYIDGNESTNPLQQSYRIDYSSRNEKYLLELSIGYFYTDSRLSLTDPADFRHKEKLLSVGSGYYHKFDVWKYKAHFAATQQHYLMRFDSTQYYRSKYDTTKAHLNRLHFNQYAEREIGSNSSVRAGLELDLQSLKRKLPDDAIINRLWSTIYGDYNYHSTRVRIGATVRNKEVYPALKIFNLLALSSTGSIKSQVSYFVKPNHLYYNNINEMENWFTVSLFGDFRLINIPTLLSLNYANTDAELINRYNEENDVSDISDNLMTASIGTQIPLIRNWELFLYYRHIFIENVYSDGIGDRVKIGLNIAERIFKNKMKLNLKLWTEGYLNHSQEIGFDGFHFGPYATDNLNLQLPDYWIINLDLSVKVSKMTFGWKVNNILKTLEGLTEQTLPNLGEEYLLITNNYNFPPLSRFVTFNIIWEFED